MPFVPTSLPTIEKPKVSPKPTKSANEKAKEKSDAKVKSGVAKALADAREALKKTPTTEELSDKAFYKAADATKKSIDETPTKGLPPLPEIRVDEPKDALPPLPPIRT